jgi:23S rRNA (guanosine2251-2'-O)-methyltransferase
MKIHVVLDNIRSAYNVGSIFRTSDGIGHVEKIHICGISAPPYHPKVHKTALGASAYIQSEVYDSTKDAIDSLKENKVKIYGVELTDNATHFQKVKYPKEVAFVLGHEVDGLSEETIAMCDEIIYIPMNGQKESLNVASSAAIILYEAIRNEEKKKK